MKPIEPRFEPTPHPSGIKAWVQEKIWVLIGAAFFALAGIAIDRMSDEMNAWIRSIFVGGIGGTYVLQTFAYPEGEVNLKQDTNIVELKDGGKTVFGLMKQQSTGFEYRLFGYHRVKYLAMSYGGRGPLGSGTLALQTEIATGESPVFWGWRSLPWNALAQILTLLSAQRLCFYRGHKIPWSHIHTSWTPASVER